MQTPHSLLTVKFHQIGKSTYRNEKWGRTDSDFRPNFAVEWLGLPVHLRTILGSIPGWEAECLHKGFRSFPHDLQGNTGNPTVSLHAPSNSLVTITLPLEAIYSLDLMKYS
jgi:hypothetical protein